MRRIKIMGLCLVAVCAMSVAVVSSASAAPEYFSKGKVITKAVSTTNKSLESPTLLGGVKIFCVSDVGKGKIAPPNITEKTKITYSGCEGGIGGAAVPCQTSAAKKGVISTENLGGELVMASEVESGTQVVANRLHGEKAPAHLQAKFSCGALKVEVKGEILALVHPVSVEAKTGESTNKIKAAGTCASEQALLFVNGAGPCVHLFTGAGESANKANDEVTYKVTGTAGIEIHP
jgi:hypothetical protein